MRTLITATFLFSMCAYADLYDEYVYHEPSQHNRHQHKFAVKSQSALMSFKRVKKRAKYFEYKIKNMTFGEYTDDVLLLAPLFTGKFEVSISKLSFYYDRDDEESGVRYSFKF